jgi:hypothetical protein
MRDIHLYDRSTMAWVAFPPGVMNLVTSPNSNDWNCRLDSSGDWVGFDDANFDFHVYSRQGDGFLAFPTEVDAAGQPWLSAPFPPEPEPAGPGAGGGAGGPGSGPGTGPGGAGTPGATKLTLVLGGKAKQRLAKQKGAVLVVARCNIACRLSATGSISIAGKAARVFKLRAVTKRLTRAGKTTLRLRLPKATAKAVNRALRRRKTVPVTVKVTARDAAGVAVKRQKKIKLAR